MPRACLVGGGNWLGTGRESWSRTYFIVVYDITNPHTLHYPSSACQAYPSSSFKGDSPVAPLLCAADPMLPGHPQGWRRRRCGPALENRCGPIRGRSSIGRTALVGYRNGRTWTCASRGRCGRGSLDPWQRSGVRQRSMPCRRSQCENSAPHRTVA